jgi:HEAT repeat protein
VQLASSLCAHSCGEAHAAEALHVLAALDEISRGGRLAMALTRLTRSASAHVASKAVLMLGRRVSNPAWIERQMAADDARIRANVIESLWGLASELARKSFRTSLQDVHNRVVGNALIGLHLLGEQDVGERLTEMINHPNPSFRATAAWAMGRRGDPVHADSLRLALDDPDPGVRKRAALSLATIEATAPG